MILRIVKWLAALVVVLLVAGGVWLYVSPPALIRVAAGYSAKIVCSNVFIAGREPDQVLAVDVQAPGNPVLKLLAVDVDRDAGTVRSGLFGLFGKGLAVYRQGTGCAVVPDGDVAGARASTAAAPSLPAGDAPWPAGERVEAAADPAVEAILDDAALTGSGMRAVVVVKDGRIVGERYGEGFGPQTPLLGWSMTKTVNAAIIGTLIGEGRLSREDKDLLASWKGDERAGISLADMLAMASGLAFNEDYGDVTDVTRMLYVEPDMAAFAADKPLAHEIGTAFNYSSGTAVILSRIWQDAIGDGERALAWPYERLFGPLGMRSAVLEADEKGTYVGSSYLYATARDWARFGQFLLQDGRWNEAQILPAGYVAWMQAPSPAFAGYGRQVWLEGPGDDGEDHSDAAFGVPDDAYWMIGHDGQTVAVVPSEGLVVVRLGLTPSKLGYRPQALAAALVKALR